MTTPDESERVAEQIAALRRELKLTWDAHEREHSQHEKAHSREHEFAQKAIETAATLSAQNKSDSNEWRSAMRDREASFATKADSLAILSRLDNIERASLVSVERERSRIAEAAEDKIQSERRFTRGQWVVGIAVGLLATFGSLLLNLALR